MADSGGKGRDLLGLATRVKALAVADPVLDLERRKSLLSSDWTSYQMEELALTAIDTVTLKMDFDDGVRADDVIGTVAAVAALQRPDRGPDEHGAVARWVLDCLVNVGTVDRGFSHVYGTAMDGRYASHLFSFKLLREVIGLDGRPRLRASNEAIAVLVGAVDIDIASEQVAADAKLDALVNRGRLIDAHRAAEIALRRTVQYVEHIRTQLDGMHRDIRAVDWIRDVQPVQVEAMAHIEERIRAERSIKDNVARIMENSTEEGTPAQAGELIEILEQCLRRNAALQANLQQVGERFRAEQERQTFVPPPSRAYVDLGRQLMEPVLGIPLRDASPVLEEFVTASASPHRPALLYLPDLVAGLMKLPTANDLDHSLVVEPEFGDVEDTKMFTYQQHAQVEAVLDRVDESGVRLSSLLARARQNPITDGDENLHHLLSLRVLGLFGAPRLDAHDRLLAAVADGRVLDDEIFAGDDLLVVRGRAVTSAPVDDHQGFPE